MRMHTMLQYIALSTLLLPVEQEQVGNKIPSNRDGGEVGFLTDSLRRPVKQPAKE